MRSSPTDIPLSKAGIIFVKNYFFNKDMEQTIHTTGGEIVGEFLMSIGYLKGAHHENCPIYTRVLEQNPLWKQV